MLIGASAYCRFAMMAVAVLLLAGCGTRSSASVAPTLGATTAEAAVKPAPKSPNQVTVTENDITDRSYQSLGDIEVTVKKWTIFDKDPTREKIDEALKEKAAEI